LIPRKLLQEEIKDRIFRPLDPSTSRKGEEMKKAIALTMV